MVLHWATSSYAGTACSHRLRRDIYTTAVTFTIASYHTIESLIAIVVLALVHLFVKELHRLDAYSRNTLLSVGAGASLAYVLMRILPKLAEKQQSLMASTDTGVLGFLEHHVYLAALAGLVLYYGLYRVAVYGAGWEVESPLRYRVAMITAAVGHGAYSMLLGYLIVSRLSFGLFSVTLIVVGMGTVLLVTDYSLYKKWPYLYNRWMRWILTIGLLAGWAVGVFIKISPNVVVVWFAFLAGVILFTTIGEKLVVEERGSFWPFSAGAAAFAGLLIILEGITPAAS